MRRRLGVRPRKLLVLPACLVLAMLALTGGAGAITDENGVEQEALVEINVPDRSAIDAGAPSHVIRPTPAIEEMRFILDRLDGRITQGELAAALRAEFPGRFANDEAAFARVSQIRKALA